MNHALFVISNTGIPLGIVAVAALVVWELNHVARLGKQAMKERIRRNSAR